MAETLVVILDCDLRLWQLGNNSIDQYINNFMFYSNAFLSIDTNQIIIYLNDEQVFTSAISSIYEYNHILREAFIRILETALSGYYLTKALSKALCVYLAINKSKAALTRILVIQTRSDVAAHYNLVMNCIFSAHKLNVKIDSIVIGGTESVFLQQASHITSGLYQRMSEPSNLLMLLMSQYLSSRNAFKPIAQGSVDNRAACSCHHKLVEFAFMCSVCLALHCSDDKKVCFNCDAVART